MLNKSLLNEWINTELISKYISFFFFKVHLFSTCNITYSRPSTYRCLPIKTENIKILIKINKEILGSKIIKIIWDRGECEEKFNKLYKAK